MATKWVRSNEIVWEELNGEALLVSSRTGASWTLNATAAAIWELCDGTQGLLDMVRSLARATGWNAKQSQSEIRSFCEAFSSLGLLNTDASLVPMAAGAGTIAHRGALTSPPSFRSLGLGSGPRRRPSPHSTSGSPF